MKILATILMTWIFQIAYILPCHAQTTTADGCPDFQKDFDILTKNKDSYNRGNDSIFWIRDHEDWIKFFLRRASRNRLMYERNKFVINEIHDYFERNNSLIPDSAYHKLYDAFYPYAQANSLDDPFIHEDICKILYDYYKRGTCNDSLNNIMRTQLWLGNAHYYFSVLGNPKKELTKAYQYYKATFDNKNDNLSHHKASRYFAASNLMQPVWMRLRLQSYPEHLEVKKTLRDMLNDTTFIQGIAQKNVKVAQYLVKEDDENLARNIFMTDSTILDRHFTDSIMHSIVERNEKLPIISRNSFYRTLLFKVYLHMISPKEALGTAIQRYNQDRKVLKKGYFEGNELGNFLKIYFTLTYLNDIADITEEQKANNVRWFCRDIVRAYKHRKGQQLNPSYIRNLHNLVTYERITRHLTSKERIMYLDQLTVASQVTTYAHSVHVSLLAEELMRGILKYHPEWLVGVLGHSTTQEVKKHKKEYIDFIHNAAMYHDVGKNSIIPVIINEYRPTTDHEFSIIKTHPQLGLQYLAIDKSLAKYYDTTMGHHKWYNGKGGYPDNFDNTKSPVKIMIDIITLCDCMQAATEKIGRNYKRQKTYDKVMGELTKDAGTRYNPYLVSLINEKPDITNKMQKLVDDGWLEIYYNIYSQFFR